MPLPFDGAISNFFAEDAPAELRKAIRSADKDDILAEGFPYAERIKRRDYEDDMEVLQHQLVRLPRVAPMLAPRAASV